MAVNVRYQIFVSSTYTDLFPVRRKVTEHILSMNHIPAGMEMFSASGREQWKTIQKAIDNSDYYVLIIGERYGSISEADGVSFTEKEFDYARQRNIPTLCFLPGDSFTTTKNNRESDQLKVQMLEDFKKKVSDNQLCAFWNGEDELVQKISTALYKIFTEEPGVGWIRGDASDPDVLSKLVKTMEDNNKLREQIREMEKKLKVETPVLLLKINDKLMSDDEFIFSINKPDGLICSKPTLTMSDVPAFAKHITQDDIDAYNNKLPSVEDIESYNNKLRDYEAANESKIKISINNTGYVKANNASIRIYFPEGIKVLRKRDLEHLKPKELVFPKISFDDDYLSRFYGIGNGVILGDSLLRGAPFRDSLSVLDHLTDSHHELAIGKDNTIYGKIGSVRQGTNEILDPEFYLLPSRPGLFKVRIELLCDEYREWQRSECSILFESN